MAFALNEETKEIFGLLFYPLLSLTVLRLTLSVALIPKSEHDPHVYIMGITLQELS